ncbi:hypothetical protein QTO34_016160 [Cnephaeus nilssonii]|uniref:Cadherin domain-containing protein n=1 Tax=Cnephaeus nilssonii TaxID=3371016 RepID=A0AA40LRT6_CNENI|nr:hypothetical protein QTO34_016160 [Eptesicus nilssonii]
MVFAWRGGPEARCLLLSLLFLAAWELGAASPLLGPEEAKHGTFVGRIAQDLGLELAELVPAPVPGGVQRPRGPLEVNLQNGILFVNSRIDREELCGRSLECSIHLEVVVERPLQVFHVEVAVKDINDNPPCSPLSYSDYFMLDVNSKNEENKQLELVLRKSVDREETPKHNLLLTATDGGKPELTGSVQVLVTVMDVNDNAPSFQQSEYEVRIFENSDNGTVVIRLNASDPDEGTNREVSYSFNSFVPPMVIDQFSIDSKSGEIKIRKNLDFEKVSFFKIRIDATDRGHPPMAGHCTVLVKVLDINDNAPQISLTLMSLPVSEDAPLGTVIALISVSDLDSGVNGHVTCTLSPHAPFKLVSTFKNYYSLVLDSALDRESVSGYAPEHTVFVKENNPPGCHIFTVSARDVDAQENALVSYSLVERRVGERALSSYVSVHAESGKVYALQPLDHEELELLQFQVSARDAGVPPLGSNVTLQVFVLDENDNAPALLPPGAGAGGSAVSELVSRSVGAGHVVAKVRAVDADSGYNAWLSYELLPAGVSWSSAGGCERVLIIAICAVSSLLVLSLLLYTALRCSASPKEGACGPGKPVLVCSSAVGSLSYSQQRRQRVCSGEGPPKTDLMAFSPSLPPVPPGSVVAMGDPEASFDSAGKVHYWVPEEAKHGTFVGRIAQDLGLELAELVPRLFRVASKDHGDLLEVNLQNGILFVNSRIDREELCGRSLECSIHLEVVVERPLQVFHVEVEVKDINDHSPVFSVSEQKLAIPESRLLDSRFPLEGASDADVGENAKLTYRLSPNEFFILDIINKKDKGKFPVLVLRKLLDREENPQLLLLLTATDGGKPELTGSVSLLILVMDANDNAPIFDRSIYEVKMYENAPNQTLVIWLNASDADEEINKELIYSFSSLVTPSIRRKFLMNERTGEIRVNDAIDFEDSNTYEIHVDVTDKGNPPMAGHCTVLVEILDENDNSPEVVVTSLSLPVLEDAQLGTVIALISVSDPGVHLQELLFLVLDSALDREKVSHYQLVVTARDRGSPSLSSTASVSVEVADVNDNAPTFAQPEYTVFVKENNPPGCHIFTVSARDVDAQENALVSYSLVERRVGERALSSYVSVHAESGKVYALQPLDHEELELLQFLVSARDAGVPPLGSNVTLQVFVLDGTTTRLRCCRLGRALGAAR